MAGDNVLKLGRVTQDEYVQVKIPIIGTDMLEYLGFSKVPGNQFWRFLYQKIFYDTRRVIFVGTQGTNIHLPKCTWDIGYLVQDSYSIVFSNQEDINRLLKIIRDTTMLCSEIEEL